MTPEKAHICIVDDTPIALEGLERQLETSDHEVILTAQTKDEALKVIELFEEYKINVVLLDTKLVFGDFEGKQAKIVLDQIRSVAPSVKVLTMSSGKPLDGGDAKISKDASRDQIIDLINNL